MFIASFQQRPKSEIDLCHRKSRQPSMRLINLTILLCLCRQAPEYRAQRSSAYYVVMPQDDRWFLSHLFVLSLPKRKPRYK